MSNTVCAIDPYSLKSGDTAVGLFYIKSISVKPKKNGGVYGDAEGYYKGQNYPIKVWDANLVELLKNVKIFLGRIRVDEYRDSLQFAVVTVELVDPDGVDETFFFDNIDEEIIGQLTTEVLPRLGKYGNLFEELIAPIRKNFYNSPAAKGHHDACVGGLAHHSLKTAKIAIQLADMYGLDSEFIGFCALIHDIGKIVALSPKTMDYTIPGMVQDHVGLGIRLLSSKKNILDKYLDPVLQHIMYGVVENHHGNEYGGNPTTLEAHLVHLADLAESRLTSLSTYARKKIKLGEVGTSTWFNNAYYFVGGHEFR